MKTKPIIMLEVIVSLLFFFNAPPLFAQVHQHEMPAKETAPQQVETEEAEEPPTIEIEPERQQMIGVRIFEVSAKPMNKIIRTVGRIGYDERKLATVNTKFEGWIEKLYVDYTGRPVKQGEPLAEIYSPELYATQQEYLNILKWNESAASGQQPAVSSMLSKDAGKLVDAARQRLKLWDISDQQIEKIKSTGEPVRTLTIYSPVSGYVIEKMAVQGMRVMPGEKLFDIADLSRLWIFADIYEYELPHVKTGQKALITLSYMPGKEFPSTIDYVYPSVSNATRTATVRFEIPNYGGQLKPQMYTNVEIKIELGSKLVVPDDAVIDTGIRQIVYVDRGEGYFEPREIRTGLKTDGFTEVVRGLKTGEKVASSATFLIDSEAQLKGVTPLKRD
ncbi:MAG: efflux RND transporter periplasmic adaptor subunit [Nitrospiraceae bacterium]|nr:MAG: efflux RND transporter periplasmic adaptor subunit [Nitrospiraceae bacterium]